MHFWWHIAQTCRQTAPNVPCGYSLPCSLTARLACFFQPQVLWSSRWSTEHDGNGPSSSSTQIIPLPTGQHAISKAMKANKEKEESKKPGRKREVSLENIWPSHLFLLFCCPRRRRLCMSWLVKPGNAKAVWLLLSCFVGPSRRSLCMSWLDRKGCQGMSVPRHIWVFLSCLVGPRKRILYVS